MLAVPGPLLPGLLLPGLLLPGLLLVVAAALAALATLAPWVALSPQAAASVPSISRPSVVLSSTSAAATAVSYTLAFVTPDAIPAGGTITVVGPAGTLWGGTHATCSFSLVDRTTPAESFTCAKAIAAADSGLPIYDFNDHSGAVVTITTPGPVKAGDSVELVLAGTENPGPGTYTLSVSTSTALPAVTSAPYTVTSGSSVRDVAVALSSNAAGAENVACSLSFIATSGIPAQGTITLMGPVAMIWAGTNDPSSWTVTDETHPSASFSRPSVAAAASGLPIIDFLDRSGTEVTVTVPNAIGAGDRLKLLVGDVFNPGAGTYSVRVATSADPVPVASAPYHITAPSAVASLSVSVGRPAKGVTGRTYTVRFVAPHGLGPSAWVTLVGPPGTVWPNNGGDYVLTDATSAARSITNGMSVTLGAGGAAVNVMLPGTVPYAGPVAGDELVLTVPGVTVPPGGAGTLWVRTTADPVLARSPVSSRPGGLAVPATLPGASMSLSSSSAGANGVTATFAFTAPGALVAGQGTITVMGAPGAVFGDCVYGCGTGNASYTITDSTRPSASGGAAGVTLLAGRSGVVVTVPHTVAAGDHIQLAVTQFTNPVERDGTFYLMTSAGNNIAELGSPVAPPTSVKDVTLSLSSAAGDASGVSYTVTFTTRQQLLAGLGSVTLAAPVGTIFGLCPYGCGTGNPTFTFDVAGGASGGVAHVGSGANNWLAGPSSTVSIPVPQTIPAGSRVTLTATQVTNPPAGAGELAVSTSSEPEPAEVAEAIEPPAAVLSPSLKWLKTPAGETCVVNFTTSHDGELLGGLGAVTLLAPAGTNFTNLATATLTDHTHPAASGPLPTVYLAGAGTVASFVVPQTIVSGDAVTLTVPAIAVASGFPVPSSVTVLTSSDPATQGLTQSAVSSIALSLITPRQAFLPLVAAAVNAGITVGLLLFITFPANLFNQTFSENYAEIAGWWQRFSGLIFPVRLRRRLRSSGAKGAAWAMARFGRHPGSEAAKAENDKLVFASVVAVGALMGSLLDPAFGVNLRTLTSFIAIVLAMLAGVAVSGLVTGAYHRARRHGPVPYKFHALPLGLVVAAACVAISRGTGFQPGYLYGLVCGVTFGRELAKHEEGHVVALSSLATLTVAVLAWFVYAVVNPVAARPGAFFGAVLADDFLASLFVSGLVGTVVSLFPLRFMPGHKLQSWHRGAWAATFGVALFLLVDALLRPRSAVANQAVSRSHAPLLTALLLFILFAVGSLLFREHFARKHRQVAGTAGTVETTTEPGTTERGTTEPGTEGHDVRALSEGPPLAGRSVDDDG